LTIAPEHTEAAGSPGAAPARGSTRRPPRVLRSRLVLAAIVVAVTLLATLLAVLLADPEESNGRPLDPGDTSLSGSHALAQLLRDQGVTVKRVTTVDEAADLAGTDTLIMINDPAAILTPDDAERVGNLAGDRLIIGDAYLGELAPGTTLGAGVDTVSRDPGCALAAAVRAGSAYTGGFTYHAPPAATRCYLAHGEPTLVRYEAATHQITVVGDGAFMSNLRLDEDGNAALAMNLTGTRPTLIWLTPPWPGDPGYDRPGTPGPGGRSLTDLLPDAVGWAVLQLAIAVLLLAYWRGRRLGPVVAERLPVVVRAAETAEGHGRLYRARRARDRASAALRAACLDRLTPRLGLPGDATPDELIAAGATRTGDHPDMLRDTLYGQTPRDDAALVRLAADLDALEERILHDLPRRPLPTERPPDEHRPNKHRPDEHRLHEHEPDRHEPDEHEPGERGPGGQGSRGRETDGPSPSGPSPGGRPSGEGPSGGAANGIDQTRPRRLQ
jgi:hypothetical protein